MKRTAPETTSRLVRLLRVLHSCTSRSRYRILFGSALLLMTLQSASHASPADSLVTAAWKAWKGRSTPAVQRLFSDAVAADPTNARAHLGLALCYTLQGKDAESWQAYKMVLTTEKNFYPYLFATWLNPRFRNDTDDERGKIVELLERVPDDPNADETARAQACENLGNTYRDRGDIALSDSWFSRMKVLRNWTLLGPFDNVSASGFDRVFPPELGYDTAKTYEGKNGTPARWFAIREIRFDGWIDHERYFAYANAVNYANTFIFSPSKQAVQVRIGTSGSLKAFLNDELLIAEFDETNNDLDTYIVETELQEGWNRLLIKCGHSEIDRCNFMVRLAGEGGKALDELKSDTGPHPYTHTPGAPKRIVKNFAEEFFKARIATAPEDFENYVLLADCYLRNDKAVDAELVLREAIRRLPDCPLFLSSIIEAFSRGRKFDEMNQTLDKLLEMDPGIPAALQHQMERALANENFDEAQDLLQRLEETQPGSELLYTSRLSYYGKRKQIDKVIETNAEALKAFPGTWGFVYLGSIIACETTRKFDTAIEMVSNFLKKHRTLEAMGTLADYYLRASRFNDWEKTFAQMHAESPAAPGWYSKQADVYIGVQEYAKAERALLRAISICPNSAAYWSKLGNTYRSMKEDAKALAAYRTALMYYPADFDARESLRELEGKRSIFSRFPSQDVDKLVKDAPSAKAYPNDEAIFLLDDTKRVVFERGASMSTHEVLVKLFKPSGIDNFKEYRINYNGNTENLIVEKAITIKKDGSQVKADVDENYVVFKSLEEGDCIYLKWKVKNYYIGKLSNHFWDTQYFNGGYPVKHAHYALLVPQGCTFRHEARRMADTPVKSVNEDGELYEWTLTDEPAIKYEGGMPGLDEVGKVLYISSIPSWEYLVDWYTDLAQTKTRASFEIKEQVAQLFAGKDGLTEEQKIRTIYNFVTENIRYSNVSFRQSALVPQKARDVLVNRIGDCKDVAALCIAMLKELGIPAHFVLVNTALNSEGNHTLPNVEFNHCIAAVETGHGVQYLDLTANNYPMGSVPYGEIGAFALRISPGVTSPGCLQKEYFTPSCIQRVVTATVRDDNSITVKRASVRIGTPSALRRDQYRYQGEEERKKSISEMLGGDYPNARLVNFSFTNLDVPSDTLTDTVEFEVPGYLSESGRLKLMRIPWSDHLTASEALSYDKRDYQYNYASYADTLIEELSIELPKGYVPMDLKPKATYSSRNATYTSSLNFSKGVLTGRRQFVVLKKEVAPEEYQAFRTFYNNVLKEDNTHVILKKK